MKSNILPAFIVAAALVRINNKRANAIHKNLSRMRFPGIGLLAGPVRTRRARFARHI